MTPARRLLPLLALLLGLAACPGPAGPVQVEVLDYDTERGDWRLATATLRTVQDLTGLTGELFDVVGNQLLTIDVEALQRQDPQTIDQDALRRLVLDRPGEPVQVSYDWVVDGNGDRVAVANDFESLSMLTVFHHFEKVWDFVSGVIGDTSAATQKHGLVGFYATAGARVGISSIPIMAADNASYNLLSDSFLILRTQFVDGIPYALNSGVIAHEFGHRLFHQNVFAGAAMQNWYRSVLVDPEAMDSRQKKTATLLQGFNEGSADTLAIAFAGRIGFIADSLQGSVGEAVREQRDVEGGFADWATYDNLKYELYPDRNDICGEAASDDYTSASWNFYCIGTVWARTLWDGSDRDVTTLREVTVPALVRAFRRLGDEQLAAEWYFDFDVILELLAQEIPAGQRAALCAAYADKFNSLMPWVFTCP